MSGFILSDDSYIYRLGIAILMALEEKLTDDNMDQVAITLNNLVKHIDYNKVMRVFDRIRISISQINRLRVVLA